MRSSIKVKMVLILGLIILAVYLLYPTYKLSRMSDEAKTGLELNDRKGYMNLKSKAINLGLDLQGGMHVVLEVDIKELLSQLAKNKDDVFTDMLNITEKQVMESDEDFIRIFNVNLKQAGVNLVKYYGSRELTSEEEVLAYLRDQTSETVTRALEILRNRVDEFGVAEPIIQKQGDNRIIIELAGITDPGRVRELIGKTAKLEFHLLKDSDISLVVAEKINNFVQSKISPLDSLQAEESEESTKTDGDTTVSLDKLFGDAEEETPVTDTAAVDTSSIFEQNLFFLNPRDKQTLLVPADKEQKFKQIIETEEVQKIITEDAGDAEFLWGSEPEFDGEFYQVYLVFKRPELTGETITEADPMPGSQMDPQSIGKFEVSLTLNDEGARIFSRVTGANIGKRLAIVLDNKVYMAPTIQVKIRDGRSRITQIPTMAEAKDLSIVLKAGALPAPVRIMEERTVGPSLGMDSIISGSKSAIYGMIIVAIFMFIYYKISGGLADLALTLNVLFIMAVMAYFNATLTLPGIAGIILTIGMAVDANVLIFERVREELARGKTIKAAIDQGYGNAFSAIVDANVTTFIAGIVLYTFGSGPIRGFALTLMIGILASMFTAIVVTRVIFDYSLSRWTIRELSI